MKRIFYFMIAAFMLVSFAATAQTVENNGVFSHMNIGVNCGAEYSNIKTIENFNFNALRYNASLELGKEVTPITEFSIEGIVVPDFTNGFEVARTDVFGNTKFNLMNLFGGYKGNPRRVEIRTVTGIGWNHNFHPTFETPNDIALQAGFEFDFNLGKNRNWYITLSPMLQSNNILISQQIKYMVENSDLKVNLGISYRLGRYHKFKIVENSVNEQDYDALLGKYNELLNKESEVDTVYVKEIVKEVIENVVLKPSEMYVNFKIGSSKVSNESICTLKSFAKAAIENECDVVVIGSADTETGSKKINDKLSLERANNVAVILTNAGLKNVKIETKLDSNTDAESSRCAIIIAE